MTVVSDYHLRKHIESGHIVITPLNIDRDLQASSIDVHLAGSIKVLDPTKFGLEYFIDPENPPGEEFYRVYQLPYWLKPGQFALGSTIEYVETPGDMVLEMWGKSSRGRLGLIVHATAGYADPGFKGHMTLELYNLNQWDIKLREGLPIAQYSFRMLSSVAKRPYGHKDLKSKYLGQIEPTVARPDQK